MDGDDRISFRFENFLVEPHEHRLWRDKQEIYLRPKVFETLLFLLKQHGRLVKKEDLLDKVWSETVVTESTLTHCIEEIRKVLQDDAYNPRFLKTVPRIGYKFIAPVEIVPSEKKSNIEADIRQYAFSAKASVIKKVIPFISIVLLLIILGVFWVPDKQPAPEIKSLAVLPFVNLNGDPEQEYFSDGMTESVITHLAKFSSLRIISRTSVMCYKGKERLLSEIGEELQVDAVIEGSVMQADDQVRITAQLVQVSPEAHLWSENFSSDMQNVITLQDEIAGAITLAIQNELNEQFAGLKTQSTPVHPDAYHAYLKGRYFWDKRTAESYTKAIKYLNQAIAVDSGYALAYAGLADCYNLLGDYDFLPPEQAVPKAIRMAEKALSIDSTLVQAYASLGFAYSRYRWDWDAAAQAFQRAIAFSPNYSEAHHWYALQLAMEGRFDEALEAIKQAQSLDPLSLIVNANIGWILYFAGRYEQSIVQLQKTLEMDPNFMSAHIKLGWVYQQQHRYEAALNEFETALALSNQEIAVLALVAEAYALAGKTAQANEIITRLDQLSKEAYLSPYWKALIYVALGDTETALSLLETAVRQRCGSLVWLKVEPKFAPLRSEPRFQGILKQIGLVKSKS